MPSAAAIVEALPIIFSLIVIEGLLSVDNALAIAARVSRSMAGETPALQ
jgi:predicted tellurium resistance membrane protein TerC